MGRNRKRWVGVLLSIILVSNCGFNVQATEANKEAEEPPQTYEQMMEELQNKKIETNEIDGWPKGPKIYGESAIVMDMETGAVLYGKGIDEKQYPASITKILTALVALENSSMTDMVRISQDSVDCLTYEYSHIGLRPGEEITMEDALYALMLASANEVAYAIGETVGGTHDNFVRMMNEKAVELGCEGTHFINTNGIFDNNHYTTARDMALISRAAFSSPELLTIVQTLQHTIPPTNQEEESRTFQQKHKMLRRGKYFDERCIAGKTGYTDEACNTLVTVMKQGDREVVAVILKSKKDTYPDTKKICDYAFEQFQKVNISENEKTDKLENIDLSACVTIPKGRTFGELQWDLDQKGNLNYTYKDQLVGTTKASLKQEKKIVEKKDKEVAKKNVVNKDKTLKILKITGIVFGAVLLIGGMIFLHHLLIMRRRRKRYLQKRRKMLLERERRRRSEIEKL